MNISLPDHFDGLTLSVIIIVAIMVGLALKLPMSKELHGDTVKKAPTRWGRILMCIETTRQVIELLANVHQGAPFFRTCKSLNLYGYR